MEGKFCNNQNTAKVVPIETEVEPQENDRTLFLQKTFTLINGGGQTDEEPRFRNMNEYKHVKFIIFPDDNLRIIWDMIIMVLMLYSVSITPYRVAFIEIDSQFWVGVDYAIDILFGIDVILNCFMAYTNHEEVLVVSHWKIFKTYLKSWMLLDIASAFPFQLIIDNSNWGSFMKLSKLPRLYRLIKIVKLVRLAKVLKNRNKVLSFLECFSKLSVGMERLIYFALSFLTICHLFACTLYFVSRFNSDNINNWVYKYGIDDLSLDEKYLASVYWTVTTLCTIGYGDVTPASDLERGFVIFLELAGVFIYSYTIGTITSLMADMDKRKSKLDAKIAILQDIAKKYNITRKFYEKLKSALEYNQTIVNKERNEMIANLPKKLALQLNIVMNKSLIDKNKFFEGKHIKFITTVIDYLKPLKVKSKEVIFRKGEFTEEMFFIKTGQVILFEVTMEIEVTVDLLEEGDYFGDVEIFLSEIRESSAKAAKACELYTLTKGALLTNILVHFKKLQISMIADANNRRDLFNRKRDEALAAYKQINYFPSMGSEPSDMIKDSNKLTTPEYHGRTYAALRKTLAPTTRAMIEENDDASITELRIEIDRLTSIIQGLEYQIYESPSNSLHNPE